MANVIKEGKRSPEEVMWDQRNNVFYKKGDRVRVSYTDSTDHVRKVFDGMEGVVVLAEKRDNDKRRSVLRCPWVQLDNGEVLWMGMFQLEKV